MTNLIKKEFKFVLSPLIYIFTILSAMVIIPSYPLWVGMFYCLIPTQLIITMATANKDMEFTAMLPVTRDDIVFIRHFDFAYIELLQVVAAIPFAILANTVISPNGNIVGMDPNMAFFGLVLVCFAVYNMIFLPWHFKSGYKAVPQMLVGMVSFGLCVGVFEALINLIPALKISLDTLNPEYYGIQAIVLVGGILIYIGSMIWSYCLSVKNFRKVNL